MPTSPRITLISGTNRPGSTTLRLTQHLSGLYQQAGAAPTVLDLTQLGPEWFTPEAYATRNDTTRPEVRAILDADGLVIVTPEYNGSFPGVLKLFIDLLPFPASLAGKPIAFVGLAAGQWGSLRAVEQLQAIFAYRNAWLFPNRVFIPDAGDNLPVGQPAPDVATRLLKQTTGFISYVHIHNKTA